MSEKQYRVMLALVFMLLISVPYLLGFLADNSQGQFGGFLMNPIDGNSYLAKMQQGFRGNWKFQLPYSAAPGEGAYLFIFYLFLGHIGRITQLPLIYIFHGARLVSAVWLLFVIAQMLRELYKDTRTYRVGLFLAVFGSGMGWLAVLAGKFTSDFWVAEAYPFLSAYTNPHFSLGLGMMIYSLLPKNSEKIILSLVIGLLLGLIQPFAVVIVSLVKIIYGAVRIYQRKIDIKELARTRWIWAAVGFSLAGGLVIAYQYWAILSDPVLVQWHQQNITKTPATWDLILSLSPCLILSLVGFRKAWDNDTGKLLLIWGSICLVLAFIPWSLQRRFLTGIYFPLAAVSAFGLVVLQEKTRLNLRYWVMILVFLAVPTNLIVLVSGIQAITERTPSVFLDQGLAQSLAWIDKNAEQEALVLADTEDGLYIPSLTGRRVIYGHPFETVQAESEQEFIENVFDGLHDNDYYSDVLDARDVDYVIISEGQGERFNDWLKSHWEVAYHASNTTVYARHR